MSLEIRSLFGSSHNKNRAMLLQSIFFSWGKYTTFCTIGKSSRFVHLSSSQALLTPPSAVFQSGKDTPLFQFFLQYKPPQSAFENKRIAKAMWIWHMRLDTTWISEIGMRLQTGCPMRIFYLETIEKNGFSGSLFPLGQNLHGGSSSGKEMQLRKTREESELVIFFFSSLSSSAAALSLILHPKTGDTESLPD